MAIGNSKKRYSISLPKGIGVWMEKQAENYGVSVSAMTAIAIGNFKRECDEAKRHVALDAFIHAVEENNEKK